MDLNVFKSDAFSTMRMIEAVNKVPFAPQFLARMGLFEPVFLDTDVAWIDEKAGVLELLATHRRGGPPNQHKGQKATARAFGVPQITVETEVSAGELTGKRAFGKSELETAQGKMNGLLGEIVRNMSATAEHMRVSCVAGKTLDSDGSTVIQDWYDFAGVIEKVIDFNFGVSTTDIREVLTKVKRHVEDTLGGVPFGGVYGIAGNNWWDAYIKHADVKAAFDRWENGRQKQEDFRFTGFTFAGVTIWNYRGSVGGVDFVNTDQCRFFPFGAGIFKTAFAPADFVETVGREALPLYAKQAIQKYDRGLDLHVQSNPLTFVSRPDALVKGTKS